MIEIIPNWHPIFVHFTVALITLSCVFFIICKFAGINILRKEVYIVANWLLWLGGVISVLTILTGFYAYNTVSHDAISHIAMTKHRNWALFTFALLLILASWSFVSYKKTKSISILFGFFTLALLPMLIFTAWRGGELVFRYGLGVMSLPTSPDIQDDKKCSNEKNIAPSPKKGSKTHDGHDHAH